MSVTDSEIQLLCNDDVDLNENHINIMRRLAIECNNDASAMVDRASSIFVNSMQEDDEFQEIVDSLTVSLRYHNDAIRDEFEKKLIKIGLYQLQLSFQKIIELMPVHTDAEICKIFDEISNDDDFEQKLLENTKESGAYADLVVTVANYQLEQYSSPSLIFREANQNKPDVSLAELHSFDCKPSIRP